MNKTFSIKRISLLLRRYFLENLYREIKFWSFITFIFTMLDHRIFVLMVLFFSGLIYSIRIHKDLTRGSNRIHYLLIPASHAEKVTTTIFLSTFYHFIMVYLSYCLGNLLVILTYHYILKMPVPVNWDLFWESTIVISNGVMIPQSKFVFFSILGLFTFSQSLFMVGSLYFRKNSVVKTITSILGFGFGIFLLQFIFLKTLWGVKHLVNAMLAVVVSLFDFSIPDIYQTLFVIAASLLAPYFWYISYLLLSEKEV
ncbi:MAG: hypothetical protein WCL70_08455 [Paludibacter sp.]